MQWYKTARSGALHPGLTVSDQKVQPPWEFISLNRHSIISLQAANRLRNSHHYSVPPHFPMILSTPTNPFEKDKIFNPARKFQTTGYFFYNPAYSTELFSCFRVFFFYYTNLSICASFLYLYFSHTGLPAELWSTRWNSDTET